MIPNQVLSDALQVKELIKGNEVRVFKLVNAFKQEPGREEKTLPEVYSLSKMKTVVDPYAKGGSARVVIGNVTASTRKVLENGQAIMVPTCSNVEFIRGLLTLTAEMNETYQYVMRRPDNGSNPFGKVMAVNSRERKPIFELVNDKKLINSAMLIEDLKYAAQKLIRETATVTEIKAIAGKMNQHADQRLHVRAYNPPATEDFTAIKLELLQKVPLFAKQIIYASTDQRAKLKVQLIEADSLGILIFEEVDKSFKLLGEKPMKLFTPDADKDKTESLMDFLMSNGEGETKYAELNKALKKVLRADPTK